MKRAFLVLFLVAMVAFSFSGCMFETYEEEQSQLPSFTSDDLEKVRVRTMESTRKLVEEECRLTAEQKERWELDGFNAWGNDELIKVIRGFGYLPQGRIYAVEYLFYDRNKKRFMETRYSYPEVRHLDWIRVRGDETSRVCLSCSAVPALKEVPSGLKMKTVNKLPNGDYIAVAVFIDKVTGQRYVLDLVKFRAFYGNYPEYKRVVKDVVWSLRRLGERSDFVPVSAWYQQGTDYDRVRDGIAQPVQIFYNGTLD